MRLVRSGRPEAGAASGFGTSRGSWGFSAAAGMAQAVPNFCAPGMRPAVQNCWTIRGEIFHFSAVSRTVRYSMAQSSSDDIPVPIIGRPARGRKGRAEQGRPWGAAAGRPHALRSLIGRTDRQGPKKAPRPSRKTVPGKGRGALGLERVHSAHSAGSRVSERAPRGCPGGVRLLHILDESGQHLAARFIDVDDQEFLGAGLVFLADRVQKLHMILDRKGRNRLVLL